MHTFIKFRHKCSSVTLSIHTFVSVHLLRMKCKVCTLNGLLDTNILGGEQGKSRLFFRTCLLPEILGNWFTRDSIGTSGSIDSELPSSGEPSCNNYTSVEEQTFYYCHGPEEGLMFACDNPDCLIEWFHVRCLDLSCVPKGKWYCSDCSKLRQLLET